MSTDSDSAPMMKISLTMAARPWQDPSTPLGCHLSRVSLLALVDLLNVGVLQVAHPVTAVVLPVSPDPLLSDLMEPDKMRLKKMVKQTCSCSSAPSPC